jgi:hypothetical protein
MGIPESKGHADAEIGRGRVGVEFTGVAADER